MAIFHLDVKNVSRSQGRSAVGAAAYRAGERIVDERLGVAFDYSNKKGVVFSEIMAPDNAPEWVKDRTQLWNAIESAELRKDSRVAKEVLVALPNELSQEERVDLIKSYCQAQFVDKGMIADINIHEDNPENPHAHILLTTREITPAGFGLKNRDWNKRELVFEQRRAWQEIANTHLHLAGHDTRIDCRSLQERGIDLEPGLHLGQAPHQAATRGQGDNFMRFIDHIDILRANGERVIRDPNIALEKLSQQQSVFDEYAIAKLANQYSVDLDQYNEVLTAIKSAKQLVALGENEYGKSTFTTSKMIEMEHHMLNQAYELHTKQGHAVNLEAATQAVTSSNLNEGQRTAFNHIINTGDLKIVTGFAGTGKSTLMKVAREAFENSGYHVRGACFSGIATKGLEKEAGIKSATVDSCLLQWEQGREQLSKNDVLVIDEAGMLGTEKMNKLLSHANNEGAKVILVHDTEQFGAIEAGAPSRAIAMRFGEAVLTEVVRQQNPEMCCATYEFATQQTEKALTRYEKLGALNMTAADEPIARRMMIEAWSSDRLEGKSQLMLAYTNDSVQSLNQAAREVRIAAGEIEEGRAFTVAKGQRSFAKGDVVYFLKNDKRLGVQNGALGTIEVIKGNHFQIKANDDGRIVGLDIRHYKHLDHGYAATIYKAQGVTVNNAYVLASTYFDRHSTYVACTRHKDKLMVFGDQKDFKNRDMMMKTLSRECSKSMAVDYAQARWIKPQNKQDLNLNSNQISQKQLARERHEIKALKLILPNKEFSFARAYECLRGWLQGVIQLSDNRQILCLTKNDHVKLVSYHPYLENHFGKEAKISLDKKGEVNKYAVLEKTEGISKQQAVPERSLTMAQANNSRELKVEKHVISDKHAIGFD
ncbi:Ti-type conjugative transfer relaxase TraA [Candidatus Berkiella aquae]|uniref:Mobilization protein A n=1 Tax=Candidatus Berkiella aquae TaxID=295108 RepID=A0A0Q9YUA9_9GAMM|nr:Ti-type conjugative transfer relaxase TraA [Candidatus Berkiella aquae]MCS5712806.1 Ti-type conjugative transfer relaxase TraA [Candidatus Berkiella aquae]